ncbi:hypothetical protein CYMTET_34232, partial [Cymbomonas tetramitiformis]
GGDLRRKDGHWAGASKVKSSVWAIMSTLSSSLDQPAASPPSTTSSAPVVASSSTDTPHGNSLSAEGQAPPIAGTESERRPAVSGAPTAVEASAAGRAVAADSSATSTMSFDVSALSRSLSNSQKQQPPVSPRDADISGRRLSASSPGDASSASGLVPGPPMRQVPFSAGQGPPPLPPQTSPLPAASLPHPQALPQPTPLPVPATAASMSVHAQSSAASVGATSTSSASASISTRAVTNPFDDPFLVLGEATSPAPLSSSAVPLPFNLPTGTQTFAASVAPSNDPFVDPFAALAARKPQTVAEPTSNIFDPFGLQEALPRPPAPTSGSNPALHASSPATPETLVAAPCPAATPAGEAAPPGEAAPAPAELPCRQGVAGMVGGSGSGASNGEVQLPQKGSPKRQDTSGMCAICWDRQIETVLLECGHATSCISCADGLKECPICRGRITRVVRMFTV